MITLAEAQVLLSRYKGTQNVFSERVNLVCERLVKSGSWRSTKDTVLFNLFRDEENRAFITLPRLYNTIMAAVILRQRNQDEAEFRRCGMPVNINTEWYDYLTSGPGFSDNARFSWGKGFIPEVDRFTTFKNWYTPKYLRLKFSTTEANGGVFNIRGKYNDQIIYTGSGANTIEGENLTTAGSTTLTTTSQFQEIPYALKKPVTYGPVRMYTWDGTTEELVAVYAPSETVPQWRRYRFPACDGWTETEPGHALCILNREWQPISNDNDFVIPGNIGALRFGLQALLKEDAEDYTRAEQLWGMAEKLLANESEADAGAGVVQRLQVEDSFCMNQGNTTSVGWGGAGFYYGY